MDSKKIKTTIILALALILLIALNLPYMNIFFDSYTALFIFWLVVVILFKVPAGLSIFFAIILIIISIVPLYINDGLDKNFGGLIFMLILLGILQKFVRINKNSKLVRVVLTKLNPVLRKLGI